MSNSTSSSDSNGFYAYNPSKIGALAAAGLFGVTAFIHLFLMFRKRTWFYTPMVIGAFMMTLGYAARYISTEKPDSLAIYIAQALLILLPPSLYAATIYMIYGRIVLFVNAPEASVIRPTRVTKIFVTGDVISFLIQGQGGGMEARASQAKLGQKVILVGLAAQLLFFGFFLTIAIIFDRRMAKSSARFTIPKYGKHSWRALLILLLVSAVIIIGRCAYRVVEFSGGSEGPLMTHEFWMYIGDTGPMFIVQSLFLFIHAGDVFPKGGVVKEEMLSESYIPLNRV